MTKDVIEEVAPFASCGPSLKRKAIEGTIWTFGAYGLGQVLRLLSNLLLTRLLFPEAFGVMALVNVAIQGLAMFSDIGLGSSIIQNPRGEEPRFLRTAWTLQVARGLMLWAGTVIIAWPVAAFYEEPSLFKFLPVAGCSVFISSFTTVNLFLANRKLQFARMTLLGLISQVLTLAAMLAMALQWRSVWALVAGTVVGSLVSTVLSYFLFPSPPMKFQFDRAAAHELFHFGKWIFVGTILGFIVTRLDRLVLGKFMTMSDLGVYSIAFMFANVMPDVTRTIAAKVLFPVYSETARNNPETLRKRTYKIRKYLMLVTLPPCILLAAGGDLLIDFLYDDRYVEAGWMLQVLAAGAIITTITAPIGGVFLAVGDSYGNTLYIGSKAVLTIAAMTIGGYTLGNNGIILAIAAASLLHYPCIVMLVRRYDVWIPRLDFAALMLSTVLALLGAYGIALIQN